MSQTLLYAAGTLPSVRSCIPKLLFPTIDHPSPEVTHLLLDIPSFRADGLLQNGESIDRHLERLPQNITVIGGNLDCKSLIGYQTIDLLHDAAYLSKNAAITARCAVRLALPLLGITLLNCPILIIGWGRIGKCLSKLLQNIGADVTVAARKESDRAILEALGFHSADPSDLSAILPRFRLVYNTVPFPILNADAPFSKDCVKIELASAPGLDGGAVNGRGLPGRFAPESAAALIAETLTRLIQEESV